MRTFQTGVGRPANSEWVDGFKRAFRREAAGSARLILRKIPGITYVTGPDFSGLSGKHDPSEQEERMLAKRIGEVVGYLCARGGLDESTATDSISLPIHQRFHLIPRRKMQKLSVVLKDVEGDSYAEGYMVKGERTAVRNGLHVPPGWDQNRSGKTPPLVHVGLGLIDAEPDVNINMILKGACQHFSEEVELMPVGPVRLEF